MVAVAGGAALLTVGVETRELALGVHRQDGQAVETSYSLLSQAENHFPLSITMCSENRMALAAVAQRLDQERERGGRLAAAGIVQMVARERRTPIFEHADKTTR